MRMHFDKEMVNPNIPRTIRFTQPLYDWLMQVKERENLRLSYSAVRTAWWKIMAGN